MREVVGADAEAHFTSHTDRSHSAGSPGGKARQSDIMPLCSRQRQRLPWTCEVVSKNTEVHFTKRTHRQSLAQASRRQSYTKLHNGIVKSTTAKPVNSLARTPEFASQVILTSGHSARSRGHPA